MPYDMQSEQRLDALAEGIPFEKKKMFGGVGYLLQGNMAVGLYRDFLIVRCGLEAWEECLADPHTKEFDITGRSMKGWVMVRPEGFATDARLQEWIELGHRFAATLPKK